MNWLFHSAKSKFSVASRLPCCAIPPSISASCRLVSHLASPHHPHSVHTLVVPSWRRIRSQRWIGVYRQASTDATSAAAADSGTAPVLQADDEAVNDVLQQFRNGNFQQCVHKFEAYARGVPHVPVALLGPVVYSYSMTKRCSKVKNLCAEIQSHYSFQDELDENTVALLCQSLLKCNQQNAAFDLLRAAELHHMHLPTRIYNQTIASCTRRNNLELALALFESMKQAPPELNRKPNIQTYNSIIDGFMRVGWFDKAFQLKDAIYDELRLTPTEFTYGTIISGFVNQNHIERAEAEFQQLLVAGLAPTLSIYTALLVGYLKNHMTEKVAEILVRIQEEDLPLTDKFYRTLLQHTALNEGLWLLSHAQNTGVLPKLESIIRTSEDTEYVDSELTLIKMSKKEAVLCFVLGLDELQLGYQPHRSYSLSIVTGSGVLQETFVRLMHDVILPSYRESSRAEGESDPLLLSNSTALTLPPPLMHSTLSHWLTLREAILLLS